MKIEYLIDPSVGPNLHQVELLLRKTLLMKNPPYLQMGAHPVVNQPNLTQPQTFNTQISQLAPPKSLKRAMSEDEESTSHHVKSPRRNPQSWSHCSQSSLSAEMDPQIFDRVEDLSLNRAHELSLYNPREGILRLPRNEPTPDVDVQPEGEETTSDMHTQQPSGQSIQAKNSQAPPG